MLKKVKFIRSGIITMIIKDILNQNVIKGDMIVKMLKLKNSLKDNAEMINEAGQRILSSKGNEFTEVELDKELEKLFSDHDDVELEVLHFNDLGDVSSAMIQALDEEGLLYYDE